MSKYKIISVDFQKEFTLPNGKWFNPGASVDFMKNIIIPYFQENNIKISEIISDYRQPRPWDSGDGCYPWTKGYESEIPANIKNKDVWIKCMNSPIRVRENAGIPNSKPGFPYQDPNKFTLWLNKNIGKPEDIDYVILIGLTLDCCVFCTAQELCWRWYEVKIIEEATDVAKADEKYKNSIITKLPLLNWADIITWDEYKKEQE